MQAVDERLARQVNAFPDGRRLQTSLYILNGESAPSAARSLVTGAACMGIPRVGSDFHGGVSGAHVLQAPFSRLVRAVGPEVTYEYIDPCDAAQDIAAIHRGGDAWACIFVNDPTPARAVLNDLARSRIRLPVMLALVARAGILVAGFDEPAAAIAELEGLAAVETTPCGTPELGILASGLMLNEIAAAAPADGRFADPVIGFYSIARELRVAGRGERGRPSELFREVAARAPENAAFGGRRIAMVGAGALGTWCALSLAQESPNLTIWDGDREIVASNLNRQVFYLGHIGEPKVEAMVAELRAYDPRGTYTGVGRFVRSSADLGDLAGTEALVSAPDNDGARITCSDSARRAGIVCATAGSSATGAQVVMSMPSRACYRCVVGEGAATAGSGAGSGGAGAQSCALVEEDAIVSSNMVAAGILVSELRIALAGGRTANLRFNGAPGARGNRLGRMVADPPCPHRR